MTAAHRYRWFFNCLLAMTLLFCAAPVRAQEHETPGDEAASPANFVEAQQEAERQAEGQEKATILLMVLFGIGLGGLCLLLVVMLWGHRVRRISRKPLPDAPRGDELFYLKKGKQPQDAALSPPPQQDDSQAGHG